MENSPSQREGSQGSSGVQRQVRLRRAAIRADQARLQRTAEFTDGATRTVEMAWPEVQRVAAFRRDVLTRPVLCVAVTDRRQVVVLDEQMDGWKVLLECLSRYMVGEPSFSEWLDGVAGASEESHWTVLFQAKG